MKRGYVQNSEHLRAMLQPFLSEDSILVCGNVVISCILVIGNLETYRGFVLLPLFWECYPNLCAVLCCGYADHRFVYSICAYNSIYPGSVRSFCFCYWCNWHIDQFVLLSFLNCILWKWYIVLMFENTGGVHVLGGLISIQCIPFWSVVMHWHSCIGR